MRVAILAALLVGLGSTLAGCGEDRDPNTIRIGHLPNLTHAQALVFRARARGGQDALAARVGKNIEWRLFDAGPTAMEALVAGSIDLCYVGPNPALNIHLKTGTSEVRVVAGSARGGSALVVGGDSGILDAGDLRGKRVATPQRGNTQDVSARAWLQAAGLKISEPDADVQIAPTQNPDQLLHFRTGHVQAVWTVEPWVSRLVIEAGGRVLVEEPDALTTVLVVRRAFLKRESEVVRRFVEAHAETTRWVSEHPKEARATVAGEIHALTRAKLPAEVVERAWGRLTFDAAVDRAAFEAFLARAQQVGFLRGATALDRLVERP